MVRMVIVDVLRTFTLPLDDDDKNQINTLLKSGFYISKFQIFWNQLILVFRQEEEPY